MFQKNELQEIKKSIEECENNIQQLHEAISSLAEKGGQLSEIMTSIIQDNEHIKTTLASVTTVVEQDPDNLNTTAKSIQNISDIINNMTNSFHSDDDEDEELPVEEQIKIVSVDAKPLRDDDRIDYSWKVVLENLTSKHIEVSVMVTFVDEDDFEIERDYGDIIVGPNETVTCTGKQMFYDIDKAREVEKLKATLNIR